MNSHLTPPRGALVSLHAPYRVGMIWAQTPDRVIGKNGTLPWHIPEDLAHFRALTRGHVVLHGRKSYEALPERFRPLPGRRNIVLTTDAEYTAPGAQVAHSIGEALALAGDAPLWVVGGGVVYDLAMVLADVLVVSEVNLDVEGDAFAPKIGPQWHPVETSAWFTSVRGPSFRVIEYRRVT